MKKRGKKKSLWAPFLRFYTKFSIPWWLFLLSIGFGVASAELTLQAANHLIKLNKGELYNSVILGYVLVTLLGCLVSIAQNMTASYGSEKVTLRSRGVIWRKILHLPMKKVEAENPSMLISRVVYDAPQASAAITYLGLFASSFYAFVRAFIALFRYNGAVTLWLLCAVPVAVLMFWLVGKTEFYSTKKVYSAINQMTGFFSEHLGAVKHFKAQNMEEGEREAGFAAIESRFRADIFKAFIVAFQVTINSIYTNLSMVILVFTGRAEILAGRMEATGLTATNQYLTNVQQFLASILTEYSQIKGTQGALEKVCTIIGEPEETPMADSPLPEEPRDIVFDHVSFGYTEETTVLHDICLTIPKGKRTAIVGANGSGKSTLLKLILRFYDPTAGTIYYGDTDDKTIHLKDWRRSFGCVLQNAALFSGTIRENLTYGLQREVSEGELIEAAKLADAYDFICQFPEGFEKEVGEGGMYLSGGQRQRIAIARSMIVDPEMLMLDEATASLDHRSDKAVLTAAEKLMQGKTTVMIAHDMAAAACADNLIVLRGGRVEATGTPEQMLADSETYRAFVRLQSVKEMAQ